MPVTSLKSVAGSSSAGSYVKFSDKLTTSINDIFDAYFPRQGSTDVIGVRESAIQQEKAAIRRRRNERLRNIAIGVGTLTIYVGGAVATAFAAKAQQEANLTAYIDDLKLDIEENQRLMDEAAAELDAIRERKAQKAVRKAARKAERRARKS